MDEKNTKLEIAGWRRYVLLEPSVFLTLLAYGMTGMIDY